MSQSDIFSLIPQRPPFVMIDELIHVDEDSSQTKFTIREGHLFVDNGLFTEPGLIENIAQTAAAGTVYNKQLDGKAAPVGYIAAIKDLIINELPRVGDTITTETRHLNRVMHAFVVQGKIMLDGRQIASCEFRIFEKKD
ncbi:MAG: 3-hydroxyacyl-ACP dehydratase [Taibaiella sp.]|nr:3-hydroxyacyl-ACP dehydratase [Taibaiella sp.]